VIFGEDESISLSSGDSAYFSGTDPHRFLNTGSRRARVLSCTTSPTVSQNP
jgi:mannose-6-phosphate isomerase-like protein (cupin superfamily)